MQTKGVKCASYRHRTLAVLHAQQALLPPTKHSATRCAGLQHRCPLTLLKDHLIGFPQYFRLQGLHAATLRTEPKWVPVQNS